MIGKRELSIEDYKAILRRRKWLLIVPAAVFAVGAYLVSLILPARYTSETVVLVEAPAVSPDIVKPIIGGDINQRLATMREEILSRTRMQKIIEKFDLYKEDIGRRPMEELVARLRNSIEVSAVSPMDRTRANGLPGFTIDATAGQPLLAQQICTEITAMFLRENVVVSEREAEDTTDFIDKQLQEAKAKLDEQDAKLADFQRRYMGSLPDESQTNFSVLTGLSARLDSVTQSISQAQQDKLLLESTLSQEIAASKLTQTGPSPDTLAQQLSTLQNQLAALRVRYTDSYPDVIKLKSEVAELQQRMQKDALHNQQAHEANTPGLPVDTPQVQQVRAQLQQIDVTIQAKTAEQARLQQEMKQVQAKLELTPAVAQQYKALTRDYQTALSIYNDFLKKQSDSEVSRDLLRRQQGEQFQVLDPPSLPQEPTFPKRRVFVLGGFVGGLGLGFAIVFFLEAQDTTLHTDKDVEQLLKLPTLALIPFVVPKQGNGELDFRVSRLNHPKNPSIRR
jgi:polysaccharide chain length determinant protein (PEP-CTERM system associated)